MAPLVTSEEHLSKQNGSFEDLLPPSRYPDRGGQEQYSLEETMNTEYTETGLSGVYVVNTLCLYVPPVLVIISTVCNVLVLVLLLQRKMPIKNSSCFYMVLIVVLNSLYLYLDCGLTWISRVSETTHFANQADWMCKVWMFISTIVEHACSWLIVLFAMDRIIFMWFPLKTSSMCTVFSAKLQVISLFVVLGVTCIHNMWTYGIVESQGCSIDPNQQDFETLAWPWVLATVCSYVPLLMSFTFSFGLSMGIFCFKCTKPSTNDAHSDRYCRLSLALCILLLMSALPIVIINLRYHFTGGVVGNYYLFIDISKLGQSLYLSFTFVPYLVALPQLRADLCLLWTSPLTTAQSEAIEVSTNQSPRGIEDEAAVEGPKTLLLSVGQRAQDSTYV